MAADIRDGTTAEKRLAGAALSLLGASLEGGSIGATLEVRGSCMAPLIRDGDTVRLQHLDGVPPPGAVVVARNVMGLAVCHRVLAASRHGWITLAGDRSSAVENVEAEAVLGLVACVERGGRRIELAAPRWSRADRALVRLRCRMIPAGDSLSRNGIALPFLHRLGGLVGRAYGRVRWLLGRRVRGECSPRPSAGLAPGRDASRTW